MPNLTLPEQTGNSCAAHCAVIAVAEITGAAFVLDKSYAENLIWPAIKFTGSEAGTEDLAKAENSDPRRIVAEAALRWGGSVACRMLFDDTAEAMALKYIKNPGVEAGLDGLFNLIKGGNAVATIAIADGVYYNASYLMLKGSSAASASFDGMHNILVAGSGGLVWYYNPNEHVPTWKRVTNWQVLDNQNGGAYSYVFTGLCVEMRKK